MGIRRCEPRISFNTNSIQLSWDEYNYPDHNTPHDYCNPSTYEGRQWMGSYSKTFTFKDHAQAIKEALVIAKECGQVKDENNEIS